MKRDRLKGHLTLIGVVLFTVLLVVLVVFTRMPGDRALVALCICWSLALHSEDVNHQRELLGSETSSSDTAIEAGS